MGQGHYNYKADFPERTLLMRLSHWEKIGDGPRGRVSVEFDGIDKHYIGRPFNRVVKKEPLKPFALLRILTTIRRFSELFDREPRIGEWYLVSIARRFGSGPRGLPCWHCQLTNGGYTQQSRGYATTGEFLFRDAEPSPSALGAEARSSFERKFVDSIRLPRCAVVEKRALTRFLSKIPEATTILVRDVGQASFVSLLDDKQRPMLHYDAGWPISFNGRSVRRADKRIDCGKAPVILSHWDWDHLHGFYRFPQLQNRPWIAPDQQLGPGAAKVAWQLHKRKYLKIYNGGPIRVAIGRLSVCRGQTGNINQTGLALLVNLTAHRTVLLVGDADYENANVRRSLYGLVVTHHGAEFSGVVPVPRTSSGRNCVVSVGKYNVYRHPRATAIDRHRSVNWTPIATASLWGRRRGDRPIR